MRRLLIAVLALVMFVPGTGAAAPQKGQSAPPFKAVGISGQQISLQGYQGKVLLVEFFATWCGVCRQSIPSLVALTQKYGAQGVNVLGINMEGNDPDAVREFIAERKINYPVVPAGDGIGSLFGVRAIPTIFIINKQGVIVEKFNGFNDAIAQKIDTAIAKLLAE